MEMNLLRRLDHKSIVKIENCYINFKDKSEPILILEFCPYGDLDHRIKTEQCTLNDAFYYFR